MRDIISHYGGEDFILSMSSGLAQEEVAIDLKLGGYVNQDGLLVIPVGKRNGTMLHLAEIYLKRFGEGEQAENLFVMAHARCEEPLPESEIRTVWNQAIKFYRGTIQKDKAYVPPEEYNGSAASDFSGAADDSGSKHVKLEAADIKWDEPIPMDGAALPEFPVEALPPMLRRYALAVSQSTQTPVDMAAVAVLTVASACMRNLYKVEGKADWREPTNIYSVVIAEPSERKSSVTSLVLKPVDEFVHDYNALHRVDFEMSRAVRQKLENRRNALVSQGRKKGEDGAAGDFNDELRSVITQLVDFREAKPLKVYVDNTTTEKLEEMLADNGNTISIISSEGGIFDLLSGTYSSKVNIDVFLKAYSGENIKVDRINRSSISVEEACLTILLSVQPVVISELMENRKFRHRGLTARFLYAIPKSRVGTRSLDSSSIAEETYLEYKALISNLLSENRCGESRIITLSSEARMVLSEFYDWVEKMLVGEFTMYSDWLGKLVGNTLRIAGILARCAVLKKDVGDSFLETDEALVIRKETMENAVSIGRYFLAHAVNAYGAMGVSSESRSAIKTIEKIREKKLGAVSRRSIMRYCRWVTSAEEAQSILDWLEDYGYIKLLSIDESDKMRNGRPKNAVYAVNPSVHR